MLLWGAFAYLAVLVPSDLARDVARRIDRLRLGAVAVAIATTIATLPVAAAEIADGWPSATDPSTLRAVLFETGVGRAWTAQLAAACALVVASLFPVRIRLAATATASGFLVAALALSGHAAMHEGWLGILHRLNDMVHVLAGGAWIGALVPLLPILKALEGAFRHGEAAVALRRFSTAGHGAVALVIATGILNTVLVLGRWPTDWSSAYQALLAAKIALVALMTFLAVANRYVVVPLMPRRRDAALRTLRVATIAEISLGLAAIACVGVFGLLEPA